jgi:hypothetical protein
MAKADKDEAIAQMSGAVSGLKAALEKLKKASASAPVPQKRKITALRAELNARLAEAETFVRHLQAANVTVEPPTATSYQALEKALADLQAIEVKTGAVAKVLKVAAAVGDATLATSTDVSEREA